MKRVLEVEQIPNPVNAPLSAGIQYGRLITTCGMAPIAPDKSLAGVGDIVVQTEKVIENIKLILAEAGATLNDVIKTTVYLADISHYEAMNEVYRKHFPAEAYPTRSTVGVQLGHPDLLVEIEVWAMLPEEGEQA